MDSHVSTKGADPIKGEEEKKKTQCVACKGVGLVKKEPTSCETCHHILACTYCNQSGKSNHPYEECTKCWGAGEV